MDHPRHQRGAVGAEDRLRGLDLDLEPERAGAQPQRGLEPLGRVDEGLDLLDRGDLGQRHHEAVRAAACCSTRRSRNTVSVRIPRRRVGASKLLNRMPHHAGAAPAASAAASSSAARAASASSSSSGRDAVAVLQVDADVLDRLAGELVADAAEQVGVAVEQGQEQRPRAPRSRAGRRRRTSSRGRRGSGRPGRRRCAPAADRDARPGSGAARSASTAREPVVELVGERTDQLLEVHRALHAETLEAGSVDGRALALGRGARRVVVGRLDVGRARRWA